MKELIDEHQAHLLMLAVLLLALLVGLAWGVWTKRVGQGLLLGALVGAGNYALWTVYNAITERLGLDTVKNLLVNLGLFVLIGVVVGVGAGLLVVKGRGRQAIQGREHGDMAGDRAE